MNDLNLRHSVVGAQVAVKILLETDAENVAMFRAEAQLLASLRHDNVVGFRGMCKLDGHDALVVTLPQGCCQSFTPQHSTLCPSKA